VVDWVKGFIRDERKTKLGSLNFLWKSTPIEEANKRKQSIVLEKRKKRKKKGGEWGYHR